MISQTTTPAVILLVDDEMNILNSLQRLLRRDGYTIVTQSDPRNAIMTFAQKKVAVVISDYKMPTMTGLELLQAVEEMSPATRKILLSGCSDSEDFIESMERDGRFRFMLKPWDVEALKAMVRQEYNTYLESTLAAAAEGRVSGSGQG